ncbi:C40 family peptidase [uncultured Jatrophihabitans sp.]|uniref:C40 family peptidase n=1 Tax=uncultured Jatrophihabitans sp. TaxID=1610747 RepID=UPI0035CB61E0
MLRRALLALVLVLVSIVGAAPALTAAADAKPRLSAGQRIVKLAKSYVGKARYVEGGASPKTGFDCSGFTRYIYRRAHVRRLPHNAEAQRHVKHMRRIPRAKARPGDLVFYLSGGRAYHVAIYAGHGMQYAAATERDGIRHQHIWSHQVEFRTLTH